MRIVLISLMLLTSLQAVAEEAPPAFKVPPTAEKAPVGVTIAFTADRQTDAEVALLDPAGKIVRHLAAGRLGHLPGAPGTHPLQKNTLAQKILWDRKDDHGRPVTGPATVRVRLGIGARLTRFLPPAEPGPVGPVTALGVGENGELYVLANRGHASCYLYVLSREGKYLRTLLPSPAKLTDDQLKGLERLTLADGRKVPVVYQGNAAHLAPFLSGIRRQQLCITSQGWIVFASGGGDYSDQSVPRHMLVLKTDGSTPPEVGFVGPRLGRHGRYAIGLPPQQFAASPDGKTFYFVGLGSATTKRRKAKGIHAVARLTVTDKAPVPFIGKPDEPGNDGAHLNTPVSVTTDTKGNLYVADAGNNRVAVFDPARKFLAETTVKRPWQLAVNSETGELFVLQRQVGRMWGAFALIKFDKAVGGKEVARLNFKGRNPVFTLDAGAHPPKLWLAYDQGWRKPQLLLPIADRGDKLELGKSVLAGQPAQTHSPLFLSVDPQRGRLYLGDFSRRVRLIDLKTGKLSNFLTASEAVVGPRGNLYVLSGYGTNQLVRLTPQGKPLPFKATGSHKISITYRAGLPHVGVRGLTVARNGDIYVYQDNNNRPMHLWVFGADGKLKRKNLIENIPPDSACSLAVDRAGNLYAGINVNDPKDLFPVAFKGVVPPYAWINIYSGRASWYARPHKGLPKGPPWNRMFMNFYINHYGSLFKFSPQGARFWLGDKSKAPKKPEGVPADAVFYRDAYMDRSVWLKGAVWRRPGFALCTNRTQSYGDPGCSCWTGRFAIDEFDRLFVPDVFRFSVGILDSNGNELARFGEYGNVDSAGPGSAIPQPAIPFAWCNAVAVGAGKVYVADRINRRIAELDLTCAAQAECAVP